VASWARLCLVGLLILLHRRLSNERVAARSTWRQAGAAVAAGDLLLGLSSIFESASHMDGHMMVLLMTWAQHIVTFRGDAAASS
jgi:nitrate reductase gamma subunit